MTFPLMALAVGAVIAGFVGVPNVLGYENCEYSDEWRAELARVSSGRNAAE